MIGQSITSFLQAMGNQTMTSTIFSPSVDRVMEESKTEFFNESHGETPGSNNGGELSVGHASKNKGGLLKGVGVSMGRSLNDLLPFQLRPIKARRRRIRPRWGWRVELYTFRRVWHSHYKRDLKRKLAKLNVWKKR